MNGSEYTQDEGSEQISVNNMDFGSTSENDFEVVKTESVTVSKLEALYGDEERYKNALALKDEIKDAYKHIIRSAAVVDDTATFVLMEMNEDTFLSSKEDVSTRAEEMMHSSGKADNIRALRKFALHASTQAVQDTESLDGLESLFDGVYQTGNASSGTLVAFCSETRKGSVLTLASGVDSPCIDGMSVKGADALIKVCEGKSLLVMAPGNVATHSEDSDTEESDPGNIFVYKASAGNGAVGYIGDTAASEKTAFCSYDVSYGNSLTAAVTETIYAEGLGNGSLGALSSFAMKHFGDMSRVD